MSIDLLKRLGWFVAFVLAQVMVLGRIHLFNCATPLLYVYFVSQFPCNYPKWGSLLWAFFMGLVIDIFSNTPGLAAASLTLIAAMQPYYCRLFVPRDAAEDLKPSLKTLGPTRYSYYIVTLVILYCLVFYMLELFSFHDMVEWVLCVAGSAALTLLLIYTFEVSKVRA